MQLWTPRDDAVGRDGAASAHELPQRTATAAENIPAASSPQGDHMQLWTPRDDAVGRDGAASAYELPQRTATAAENMPASSPQGDHMQLWTPKDDAVGRDGAASPQGDQSWPAPRDDADDAPPPRWDPRGVDEALLPLSYALLPLSSSWPCHPFHAGSWAGHRVAW